MVLNQNQIHLEFSSNRVGKIKMANSQPLERLKINKEEAV